MSIPERIAAVRIVSGIRASNVVGPLHESDPHDEHNH